MFLLPAHTCSGSESGCFALRAATVLIQCCRQPSWLQQQQYNDHARQLYGHLSVTAPDNTQQAQASRTQQLMSDAAAQSPSAAVL